MQHKKWNGNSIILILTFVFNCHSIIHLFCYHSLLFNIKFKFKNLRKPFKNRKKKGLTEWEPNWNGKNVLKFLKTFLFFLTLLNSHIKEWFIILPDPKLVMQYRCKLVKKMIFNVQNIDKQKLFCRFIQY